MDHVSFCCHASVEDSVPLPAKAFMSTFQLPYFLTITDDQSHVFKSDRKTRQTGHIKNTAPSALIAPQRHYLAYRQHPDCTRSSADFLTTTAAAVDQRHCRNSRVGKASWCVSWACAAHLEEYTACLTYVVCGCASCSGAPVPCSSVWAMS